MNVVRISDGLGNQMFQYAFARKIQFISGKKVYLDTRFINHEDVFRQNGKDTFHKKCDYRKYGLEHFNIILPKAEADMLRQWKFIERKNGTEKLLCNLSKRHLWPWWYNEEDENGQRELFKLRTSICPVYFRGYFFDIRYYDDIRRILQREFRVKIPINLPLNIYQSLQTDNTVGLHIRRGDFTKLSRDISQTEYYPNALRKMNASVDNPVYMVFSDDIEWVKENIEISGRRFYISEMGFSDYEELTIMKHCRHDIIANSTFSYWAAYLNNNSNKIVICPKRWKNGIIPKEWIRI